MRGQATPGPSEQPRGRARVRAGLATVGDIILIVARAHAATELYDDLRRRSDIDLADQGLKRADLPRIAFMGQDQDLAFQYRPALGR